MRNKLLSLLLVLMVTVLYGQKAARENCLLEIGTGTWCTYCPGAAMGADDLVNNGHDVAVAENHNGDAFANTYSNARNSYYGISSFPTAKFDGVLTVVGGSHTQSMYGSYLPKVNQRLAIPSDFSLSMAGATSDEVHCELVINASKLSGSYGLVRLHVYVTESDIPYNWQGQNELNFVNRLMVPNQNGTTLNFSSQSTHQVTLNFNMSSAWEFADCEVVAFLQNNSTKEVYQTIKLSMTDFSNSVVSANFVGDPTSICARETVTFTDVSTGNNTSWNWSFPGGTPSSATGQGPHDVVYDNAGSYDVSLTVSDGVDSDTEVKTNYITVNPLEADFAGSPTILSVGESVNFVSLSSCNPTSWNWTFEGGTPATYSGQYPPPIYYNTPGTFDVTLVVSDGYDTETELKENYISVSEYCLASGGSSSYLYISNVSIGDINNSSGQTFYADFSYLSTDLAPGQENVGITISNGVPYDQDDMTIWADWNNDGDFDDAGEEIVCVISIGWSGTGVETFYFDVPQSASGPTKMRIRLKYNGNTCGDPCGTTQYGEVEDYTLNIVQEVDPPVADFSAGNTTPEVDETVSFTDLSTNAPDTWLWAFNPTTVTYRNGTNSGSQNPQVSFDGPGYYTVSLTVSNAGGSDQEVKDDYIFVADPIVVLDAKCILEGFYNGSTMNTNLNSMLPLDQPYNQAPWNYGGSESVVSMPADIVDWAIVELRDAITVSMAYPNTMIGMQAALLREDGKIVGLDGSAALEFDVDFTHNLYLVVHQRNHLSLISSAGLTSSGGVYTYDFSDGSTHAYGGSNAQSNLGGDVWGLFSGDANADGTINMTDINTYWESAAGEHGYQMADFNGDGEVDNADKDDFGVKNENKSTYVPQ